MQKDAFAHVQRLPFRYFDRLPAGSIVSRITNDTKAVRMFFQVVLSQILIAFLYGIGILGSLTLIDLRLMVLAMLALPFIVLIVKDYRSKASYYTHQHRRAYGELNGVLNEMIRECLRYKQIIERRLAGRRLMRLMTKFTIRQHLCPISMLTVLTTLHRWCSI